MLSLVRVSRARLTRVPARASYSRSRARLTRVLARFLLAFSRARHTRVLAERLQHKLHLLVYLPFFFLLLHFLSLVMVDRSNLILLYDPTGCRYCLMLLSPARKLEPQDDGFEDGHLWEHLRVDPLNRRVQYKSESIGNKNTTKITLN